MKKVCETCKWYETYTGACCNGDSDYCADYVSSMNSCENWEGGTMTKDDWQNVIIKLDTLEVFSSCGRCKACVYESNCDEHTDCNEGMAEFMAKIEQEVNNDEKC